MSPPEPFTTGSWGVGGVGDGADAAPAALGEAALCQMARYACAAASLSTERPGGLASIPAPSAVLARL